MSICDQLWSSLETQPWSRSLDLAESLIWLLYARWLDTHARVLPPELSWRHWSQLPPRRSFRLLGQQVFPEHIQILEDPHVVGGVGSAPFDEEGVRTVRREVVRDGVVQGYFLSTYSARKLGMRTTGNSGGSHNLTLSSALTARGDTFKGMLKKMGTGLLVIELMGQGVNYVTGDYSRGASGFWVEKGRIAYPVQEITIAGNLKDMLLGIEAVGADAYNYGAKTTGSLLVNRMKVAGS